MNETICTDFVKFYFIKGYVGSNMSWSMPKRIIIFYCFAILSCQVQVFLFQ